MTLDGEIIQVDHTDKFAHRRSPQVGNWPEAEMWNGRIKEPISGIGYFLFTGDV